MKEQSGIGIEDLGYYHKYASDSDYTFYKQYSLPLGIIYIYEHGEGLRVANRNIKYTIGSSQGYGPYVDPSQWAMWFMTRGGGNYLTGPLNNTFSNSTTKWDGKHGIAVVDNNKIIAVSSVMQDSDTAAMGRCLDIRNQQRAYDLWKAALDCVEEDPETGEVSIDGVDLKKTYYISVYRNTNYGQKLIRISEEEPTITIPDNPRIVFKKIDERGHELSGAEFTITIGGAYWYDEYYNSQGNYLPYTYNTNRAMAKMGKRKGWQILSDWCRIWI